ncbi:MAG: acetylxylan esterase [Acidobacteriaceae bacterium]
MAMHTFASRLLRYAVVISCCGASIPLAQAQARAAYQDNRGRAQLEQSLNDLAAKDLAARQAVIATITTRQAAELRQRTVRKKILALIGGLPERTPLHARIVGTVAAEGFHIEKVIYESQPHFYVTALLYVPDGKPAGTHFPAILMTPGHYPTSKAVDYPFAAAFARNGFVVLSWDPLGQGERLQYPDPANPNHSLATRPTGEHGEASLQPMLIGDPIARYFVWDAIRGIDYLSSLPEVDPHRIGALGCSGGGADTALLAALDPRVAAAGVACYNTSFSALLASIGAQEGEQSIPDFIASGLDFPDWIELVAPRPYAEIATYADMFPFSGARDTAIEARRFYSLFDPASAGTPTGTAPPSNFIAPALNADTSNVVPLTARFQFITGPGHHGALAPILGNILGFFLRNLQPGSNANHPILVPPEKLPEGALQVTPTGQVSTSFPGCATVFSLNLARAARIAPTRHPSGAKLIAAIRAVTRAPAIPGQDRETQLSSAHSGPVEINSGDNVHLHGILSVPNTPGRHSTVLLLVPDSILGNNAIARANKAEFDRLAAQGNVVLAMTPAPSPPGTEGMKSPLLGPFYLLSLRADVVGRTLLGTRMNDVIRIVDALAARADVDPRHITAIGSGHMGLVLLHAAVLDPHLAHVTVNHTLVSYRSLLHASLPIGAPEDVLPGVLLHYDIPDLVRALGARVTVNTPALGTDDLSKASTPLSELTHQ